MNETAAPQPQTAPPTPGTDTPSGPEFGMTDDGFRLKLGTGLTIESSEFGRNNRASFTFDPTDRRARMIPGLVLESVNIARGGGTVDAKFDIPLIEEGALRVRVQGSGETEIIGRARAQAQLPSLGNPTFTATLENGALGGALAITDAAIAPGRVRGLTTTASGNVALQNGKLSGAVNGTLAYDKLGTGALNLRFDEAGRLAGDGYLEVTAPVGTGARLEIGVDEAGAVTGSAEIPAASIAPEIGGLSVPEGTLRLSYADRAVTGGLEGVKFVYAGLGEATVNATIEAGRFTGSGELAVTLPGISEVTGSWGFRQGNFSGTVTLQAGDFPETLPISGGRITGTLGETGAMSFSGEVAVTLGPAGTGQLRASYSEAGELMIGATIDLTVPGLQGASFTINYVNGALEGSAEIPVATDALPGITGNVNVTYAEGRWSGETELHYEADDGKLSGTVRISVAQTEDGALQVTGGGDVTAQIAPRLSGTLRAEILPDQTIDVSGQITVTEPLELFPEWRTDRELFRISQNIPLWAILVAVIRVRGGVRAGIGPGVFRDITVTGEYTIGAEGEPSFSISGEMYIPAFVEAYVAFGAGLGLDVVLGSLTGGIEGVASAGIYGAVSVVPELSYRDGDYMIEGTATLAAGARLKVGLNAWAEVEAAWITVWEETWELAEWVWSIGPDLGLEARMAYNFSNPAPPTIEFTTSDIDTDRLIREAMPEDGPAGSGAREAIQNRAEWQGRTRAPGPEASTVPADLQQQAAAPVSAPPAPARPPREAPPPGATPPGAQQPGAQPPAASGPQGGTDPASLAGADPRAAPAARPGAAGAPRGTGAAEPPPPGSARPQDVDAAAEPGPREAPLPDSAAPETSQPRYPSPPSPRTLDEPPATLPRTRAEQEEDLNAASAVVSAIEQSVEDTDALVAYFPQIRRRFALRRIDLDAQGTRAGVEMEINPVVYNEVDEKLRGRELTRDDGLDLATEVSFFTDSSTLGTEVGTRMAATLLGPDHPEGSGPSDQASLMAKLPSQTGSEDMNFIRGHLLNDNLGGPGIARNLFPITQRANRIHEQSIENQVKRWVNEDRYWVAYTVEVVMHDHKISDDPAERDRNYVTATFNAEASVLTTSRRKLLTRQVSVRSRANLADAIAATSPEIPIFEAAGRETAHGADERPAIIRGIDGAGPRGEVTERTTTERAALLGHQATADDLGTEVALAARNSRSYILDPDIAAALSVARTRRPGAVQAVVDTAVRSVPRLGPSHSAVAVRFVGDLQAAQTENVYDQLGSTAARAAMTQLNNNAAAVATAIRREAGA